MFLFKACPRCHGDIFVDRDSYGTFLRCLQCGYLKDLEESPKIRVRIAAPKTERTKREVVPQ